jgi:peptidoglycan/LPS O-acetylase OafA/YrhL
MKTPSLETNRIDTLRGLACLLLVMFHVVGNTDTSGLNLDRSHGLVLVNELLSYFRMPLFSVLSGYVYAQRPFHDHAGEFVLGKVRRLLIPMLVVGTAFALMQAAVPGTSAHIVDWRMLHIVPVAHYWFLESLFLIFMAILALERINALSTKPRFVAVLVFAAAAFIVQPLPVFFGMSGAVHLFPFVLFGLWCGRFARGGKDGAHLSQLQLSLLLFLVVIVHVALAGPELPDGSSLCALALGLGGCLMLLRSGMHSTWLAWVGDHSYAIFLFHVMGSAAARIVLTTVGFESLFLLLPAGMIAGVLLPLWSAKLLRKLPFAARWVLGESASKQSSTRPSTARELGATAKSSSVFPWEKIPAQHRMKQKLRRILPSGVERLKPESRSLSRL